MKASELLTKTTEELQTLLAQKRAELVEQKRSLHSGELANPRSISNTRRDIAKLLTVMKQQATAAKEEK
ncbi:50S ribosomal protein L29 [Candidatus Saccharibacteria bacterium]|nr:MAG: 50S ribosomal protein L29 [Candidatus Saccharibacteria bacterium]